MNNFGKNLALWVIIGLLLIALFNLFQGPSSRGPQTSLAFSDFLSEVEAGRVSDVTIQGDSISGHFQDGRSFSTYAPYDPNLVNRLTDHDVRISAVPLDESMPSLLGVLVSWFPMLLLIGVWVFFMRQMQSGGGKAMGFGKSRARLLTEKHGRVTFNDVAGIDEAKEELQEIVEFLKNPQKFQAVGGRIPKGVLLVGPPGTGKTLLARAIAGEANVPFFTISGSDFVEMFVGVGASRVRDMFEQAKKHAPCIVFIDEIDAVGRHRGAGLGGGNDEREQTLNQLLVEMDGFEANEGVILIAATNRPDVLDPALLRPGRFDRQVVVPNPDVLGREKILNVHIKKVRVGPDVDTKVIARGTPGFSGADLANIVNEAALLAARAGKRMVTMSDFEAAKDKVMMGVERRSMVMSEEEKRLTAYHEAGHAVMAYFSPASDPIHKATIIPRGRALGMVMRLPEGDRISVSREKLEADIAVAMGGRVAEELVFGRNKVTAGAASDIEQATKIARHMVTQWGMSDELGPVGYAENQQEIFLGHSVTQTKNISEATAQTIDREIRRIVEEGHALARKILSENRHHLDRLAQALLEHETLTGEEINAIMRGEPLANVRRDELNTAGAGMGKRGSVPTTRPSGGEPPPAGIEPSPQPGA
ncbi:ATP-dependent zinc metalloprotease FtsH [Benzoatithermus flavus]|uniref:ATP-dependent zinc metalloprotease FtsH n=1 Tax=Benzoatithermus flavus TaxID=3108223 RepID=A0ABU8XSX5_9PROT